MNTQHTPHEAKRLPGHHVLLEKTVRWLRKHAQRILEKPIFHLISVDISNRRTRYSMIPNLNKLQRKEFGEGAK
jgi:tyrosine-protein phosphatase YwqE